MAVAAPALRGGAGGRAVVCGSLAGRPRNQRRHAAGVSVEFRSARATLRVHGNPGSKVAEGNPAANQAVHPRLPGRIARIPAGGSRPEGSARAMESPPGDILAEHRRDGLRANFDPMKSVFADTLYWVAVMRPDDPHSDSARRANPQHSEAPPLGTVPGVVQFARLSLCHGHLVPNSDCTITGRTSISSPPLMGVLFGPPSHNPSASQRIQVMSPRAHRQT